MEKTSPLQVHGHDNSHNGRFLRRFLAISVEIEYNAESREHVGSGRLLLEATMLDDDAYLRWLDQCGFSDPTRTLLTDIRRSPPVRRVAGGRGNIHGRYCDFIHNLALS
jgi:hypothetical protein